MRSSRPVVGFVVALSLSVAPFSAAGDAELAWIGQIPGLKPALQRGGPTGEAIYEVKGDPAVVFEKLHAGFVRKRMDDREVPQHRPRRRGPPDGGRGQGRHAREGDPRRG